MRPFTLARVWSAAHSSAVTAARQARSLGLRICHAAAMLLLRRGLHAASRTPASPVQITRLANGLRVATDSSSGHVGAIAISIGAGARHEDVHTRGAAQLIERLAFKSTLRMSHEGALKRLEALGGCIHATAGRDAVLLHAAFFPRDMELALPILTDAVRYPVVHKADVDEQRGILQYEVRDLIGKYDLLMPELVHATAWPSGGLGNALAARDEIVVARMAVETVQRFQRRWFRPENVVVAAAGVEHAEFVRSVERLLGDWTVPEQAAFEGEEDAQPKGEASFVRTVASLASSLLPGSSAGPATPTPRVPYVGGTVTVPPPDPGTPVSDLDQPLTRLHVFLPAMPQGSTTPALIYPLATLQLLLGGGGAFSSGGPGKGIYSRIYTRVLNRRWWMEQCHAMTHVYPDTAMFGITAAALPDYAAELPAVIAAELTAVCEKDGITPEELSRAKRQLLGSVAMNLEQRALLVEDIARQVQVLGRPVPLDEMETEIAAVQMQDVVALARKMILGEGDTDASPRGKPTIVIAGENTKALRGINALLKKFGVH